MALKIKLLLNVSALLFFLKISFGAEKFSESDSLFLDQKPLKIKINYSNKNLNKNTNDSTFIRTKLLLIEKNINKEIFVSLRARGNFRRKHCYFTPVKIKIKKSDASNTIF